MRWSDVAETPVALRDPYRPGRRVHRLGPHLSLAVNHNILSALGLAALAWAAIVASILAATH